MLQNSGEGFIGLQRPRRKSPWAATSREPLAGSRLVGFRGYYTWSAEASASLDCVCLGAECTRAAMLLLPSACTSFDTLSPKFRRYNLRAPRVQLFGITSLPQHVGYCLRSRSWLHDRQVSKTLDR